MDPRPTAMAMEDRPRMADLNIRTFSTRVLTTDLLVLRTMRPTPFIPFDMIERYFEH
jgi:hypothetical protein